MLQAHSQVHEQTVRLGFLAFVEQVANHVRQFLVDRAFFQLLDASLGGYCPPRS